MNQIDEHIHALGQKAYVTPAEQREFVQHFDRTFGDVRLFCSSSSANRNNNEAFEHLTLVQNVIQCMRAHTAHLPFSTQLRLLYFWEERLARIDEAPALVMPLEPAPWAKRANGHRYRKLDVNMLRLLVERGHSTDAVIAQHLGSNERTVRRRRHEEDLPKRVFEQISDAEAIRLVRKHGHGRLGNHGLTAVRGKLKKANIKIRTSQLRRILVINEPQNASARYLKSTRRRVYTVPYPNSLWHIDGHHKLVRWKFVVIGVIDGHSRAVTSLRVADNNRSESALAAFMAGVQEWGLPQKVRADHGKENLRVRDMMLELHGLSSRSFIQGKSVHNQRIERLWVDLQAWCTRIFADYFRAMESDGILDVDEPHHLYCLHLAFLPHLERAMIEFTDQWNYHGLSTCGGKTPHQMWLEGRLQMREDGVATTWPASVTDHPSMRYGDASAIPYAADTPASRRSQEDANAILADYGRSDAREEEGLLNVPRYPQRDEADRDRAPHPDDPHIQVSSVEHGLDADVFTPAFMLHLRSLIATPEHADPNKGVDDYLMLLRVVTDAYTFVRSSSECIGSAARRLD